MKKLLPLLLILLIFVAYTLISTGFFRTVENQFNGKVLEKVALVGAEDIMVSVEDSFALISSTARKSFPTDEQEIGGLYLLDLSTNNFSPIHLSASFKKPFAPHGISYFKNGDSYRVMAINHTPNGHFIEVFELQDKTLSYLKTIEHPSLVHPNDLVMLDENRFYVTNDHRYTQGLGKLFEEYSGLGLSNVVYFDGQDYREVAGGIAYANGINYDQKRNLVYVASVRGFSVNVYKRENNGSLTFIENIPCGTGVDNIELDSQGKLWIGCHPSLLRFNAYAKGKKETSPSEIIVIDYISKGEYSIENVYAADGKDMSGSSVAAPFGDLIFTGNVMDDSFLILQRN